MINYISDKRNYKEQKRRFLNIFKDKSQFEENRFRKDIKYFLAFDFDFIHDDKFDQGIKSFLTELRLNNYTYYTIDPSPEKYFYKYFNKYNIGVISIKTTDEELNNFLMRDPGGSPADALAINSQEIALFSEADYWGIVASRDFEIGFAGFSSNIIKNLFLSAFDNSTGMINTVKEQVDILELDEFARSKLIKNYSDRKKA